MPYKKEAKKEKKSHVMRLQKQVTALTQRVGYPERFTTEHSARGNVAAFQSQNNRSAHYCINISPPTAHSTFSNVGNVGGRTGKAINLKSYQLRLRVTSQASRINGGKVTIYMVRQPANNINLVDLATGNDPAGIDSFLQPDPWLTEVKGYDCYTTQSLRQMDSNTYSKFRVMAKTTINMPADAGSSSQTQVRNVDIFRKVQFPVEWEFNESSSDDIIKNPIYLVAVCDGGDQSALTGFQIQHNIKYFYTDN